MSSKFTLEKLNDGDILVGNGHRPWWAKDAFLANLPESPLYAGPIPADDIMRRLFAWDAVESPVAALVADPDGTTLVGSAWHRVDVIPGRKVMTRSDTGQPFGIFSGDPGSGKGYQGHGYADLYRYLQDMLAGADGTAVGADSAGLLGGGARGWVTVSVPDAQSTPEGLSFRPRLTVATSLDGTLATTWKRSLGLPVCDNTVDMMLAENGADAPTVKVKHTRFSPSRVAGIAETMGILAQTADLGATFVANLATWDVSTREWDLFLDAVVPMPETPGRGLTLATNKRDILASLYTSDHRAAPWAGTALGVFQAMNTYAAHLAPVRGMAREYRQADDFLSGKLAERDGETLATLARVTGRTLATV